MSNRKSGPEVGSREWLIDELSEMEELLKKERDRDASMPHGLTDIRNQIELSLQRGKEPLLTEFPELAVVLESVEHRRDLRVELRTAEKNGDADDFAVAFIRMINTPPQSLIDVLFGDICEKEDRSLLEQKLNRDLPGQIPLEELLAGNDRHFRLEIDRISTGLRELKRLLSQSTDGRETAHSNAIAINAGNAAQGDDEAEGTPAKSDVAYSDGFRSVRWFGDEFTFTPTQAACVKVLWRYWEQGTPGVGQVTILDEAGSCSEQLRNVFKGKKMHPAWGTMIKTAGKGVFKLEKPAARELPGKTPLKPDQNPR